LDSRPEFLRVTLEQTGGDFLVAHGTGNQRSSRVKSMSGAMGLVKLPSSEDGRVLPTESLVEAILL
jgi:molybdopterin biosynthesis enzyme